MVIYGEWEGDQDRRLPAGRDLRDGGRACPAEEEIGSTVSPGHVHDERGHFGRKAPCLVGIRDCLPIALPRLVDEEEPILQLHQAVQGFADDPVDRVRPLAAAEDKDREERTVLFLPPVFPQGRLPGSDFP